MLAQFLHHQIMETPLWGFAAVVITVAAQELTELAIDIPLWVLLLLIYIGSAVSGVAHMYWKGEQQPLGKWIAAGITCGFLGLGVAMLLYSQYSGNLLFLAGVSLFAGMGSSFTIDLLRNLAERWVRRFSPPGGQNGDKQ